jgi:hypothetical protein
MADIADVRMKAVSEEKAAVALEQLGWLRAGNAWYLEVAVPGHPRPCSTYIPGPATAVLAIVMRADMDSRPN